MSVCLACGAPYAQTCESCGREHYSAVLSAPAVGLDPRQSVALHLARQEPPTLDDMPASKRRAQRDALALQVGAAAVLVAVFVLLCWALA